MKYSSYLMIMIMLIGLGSLFVIKRPDGKPWLSVDMIFGEAQQQASTLLDKSKQELNNVVDSAKKVLNDEETATSQTTIYKWQDAKGNWHYSDRPNTRVNSQVHTLDPTKITIMAAENTEILEKLGQEKGQADGKIDVDNMKPTDVKKLVKDAQNLQKLMDERAKTLEDI
ncbi:DUF4124 domain-containing protein [Pseudoalteromonas luteoviolacea]|uniref:DUF4124 domain-containing protein n=1 Tax=Pseudoalteromonas luteoviolacea DSM 6061 TaxID=1365250 RepID=A0A166W2Y7_9GAMM|nr:DUF4124 domain-containing protein [Pseudoalteromonas luteoviolacea]KZN35352.1 hypothetical protein N475_18595 [Pseudoalteromonas luteoviolacea DSM 6061]KZN53473.1 hypothetical protein N474_20665 [Pseudoalteromonas luteoviolacea CPMOR-2]MBE0387597.1 hypothetical protein [Pseudoalteromonas luteoviolacea DSM 6061]TQF72385.1 DUF4124 domain-containing protein [Pseudoalteromonas luteoviolacea]